MRNTNRDRVAALAHSVLASLDGTRLTAQHLRAILDEMKATIGCADCGYNADPRALDLAHVDEATKYRTKSGRTVQPSDMSKPGRDGFPRYSQTVVLAEAAKCDVLCATCHRLRTFADAQRPWAFTPAGPRDLTERPAMRTFPTLDRDELDRQRRLRRG